MNCPNICGVVQKVEIREVIIEDNFRGNEIHNNRGHLFIKLVLSVLSALFSWPPSSLSFLVLSVLSVLPSSQFSWPPSSLSLHVSWSLVVKELMAKLQQMVTSMSSHKMQQWLQCRGCPLVHNMVCGVLANHAGTTTTVKLLLHDPTAAMVVLYLLVSSLVLQCHSDPTHMGCMKEY